MQPISTVLIATLALAGCLFPMSRGDLEAANAQQVQRMCSDTNYAYESGYNNGLKRGRLDTTWVDTSCAPTWRDAVRQSYQTGYNTGIQSAPIVVQGVGGVGGVASTGTTCRFSSDCADGQSCRKDRSGVDVCMGGGYSGDPCWFSSDCVSGSCDSKTCR